jgi:hypothetical protein
LAERLLELPGAQVRDPEIDEDRGRWRQERNRALKARARAGPVATIAQNRAEKRITLACRRIQPHALTQFRRGALFRTAVPQRHTEVIMRVRRIGPKRECALQVPDAFGKIALLSQREAKQRVCVGVCCIETQRFFELLARTTEVSPTERVLRASIHIVCGAGRRWRWFPRSSALLLQLGTERVVGLAHLRIDLERSIECRNCGGNVAGLSERLPDFVVHQCVVWIGVGHAPQVLQRAFEVSRLTERGPEVQVRANAVRLQREGLLEHLNGFAVIAALRKRGAQVRVRASVLRIQCDGFPEFGDRPRQVRLFRQGDPEPVVRFRGFRTNLHGPLERLQRARSVVSIQVR